MLLKTSNKSSERTKWGKTSASFFLWVEVCFVLLLLVSERHDEYGQDMSYLTDNATCDYVWKRDGCLWWLNNNVKSFKDVDCILKCGYCDKMYAMCVSPQPNTHSHIVTQTYTSTYLTSIHTQICTYGHTIHLHMHACMYTHIPAHIQNICMSLGICMYT